MAFSAFAVAAPGLEPLTAAELRTIGIVAAPPERGGVAFDATERMLADALVHLRIATRVLVRVAEFRATSFAQLEQRGKAVRWAEWVAPGAQVHFRVTCRKSRLYHSDAVAQRLATALTGAVRGAEVVAAASNDDDDGAGAQLFVVRMSDNMCTISVDAAGEPLFRRGYRQAVAKAPLRETLAAAMLAGAAWDSGTALYDPMCGSGTLVIEGALIARRMAPGLGRAFAAERWPAANASVWRASRAAAQAAVLERAPAPLVGSDRDDGAIRAANANAERAGVMGDVQFVASAVSAAECPAQRGLLIVNPPYGVRVGESQDLRNLYATFGRVARARFAGWRCAMLSADRSRGHTLERQIGVDLREMWKSNNGGIPVRLVAGDIPSGKRRAESPR